MSSFGAGATSLNRVMGLHYLLNAMTRQAICFSFQRR